MNVEGWLAHASKELSDSGIDFGRLEARMLLERALSLSREELLSKGKQLEISESQFAAASYLLRRRMNGEPMAHVVGSKEFFGRPFKVNASVLIPRPETELLAEALALIVKPDWNCIDVGTGSGCLAITVALEKPGATWVATDTSATALDVARENAHDLGSKVTFVQTDVLAAFAPHAFDVVVSNPPYIAVGDERVAPDVHKWEPHRALYAGESGIEFIERLIDEAKRVLRAGGWLAFEFGMGQAHEVAALLWGWEAEVRPDLEGTERFALARSPG
ncbi:MAG: peptide chain release factor N(5)-glutamine methyltransferase [Armatimonadota bacterium]|nr:peptide chain release factor N(5)-glutamine methyltransferase [Armatimonadota bacterium]